MKVKDFVEYLQTLDQERGIWVAYDFPCAMYEPIPDEVAGYEHADRFWHLGVRKGDYVIDVG